MFKHLYPTNKSQSLRTTQLTNQKTSMIRLLSSAIPDLPDASETSQSIDYFRISVQFGQLKGARPLEVHWCLNAPQSDPDNTSTQISDDAGDISSRFRGKSALSSKSTPTLSDPTRQKQSQSAAAPTRSSISRPSSIRPARQPNHLDGSSNVNLGESQNNKPHYQQTNERR